MTHAHSIDSGKVGAMMPSAIYVQSELEAIIIMLYYSNYDPMYM